jgi:IclR family transcriptional regulator, acetate operon repressor
MRKPVLQKKPPYPLGSVDKALQLIQVLRDSGSLRLVDAATELEVAPSTAHRLLSMLVYRGFAIQDDGRTYLPGPSMGEQPVITSGSLRLKTIVQPHLEALAAATGETANLMIRVGVNVRFLHTVESRQPLRVGDRRGAVLPARRASGGLALLAELEDSVIHKLFRGAEDDDPADADVDWLLTELARVRRQRFATNLEATEDGVAAVGTALHGRDGAIAAISVSLPMSRMSTAVRESLIDAVLQARFDIETELAVVPIEP